MKRKQHLPEKICADCKRPFKWRRKWKQCWDQVRYCSSRCRRDKRTRAIQKITEPDGVAP
ncbi:MAG: DUF2256 domain-containing protein [Acidobacteria bacterium]|nr:MAG: DUF2256 domain-containing protein [Acidobacteriota bacterium]REK01427.1 MAG: DUF2256 domain-containing protein [Acidobacteriota bacterium]REK14383.1 MAG: DUF2256 domain-containing protein [Acidobacteriota bacterium]REK45098.1 MAG: DUF2256 domain-containing protein [Acidobacteriota bacterium]